MRGGARRLDAWRIRNHGTASADTGPATQQVVKVHTQSEQGYTRDAVTHRTIFRHSVIDTDTYPVAHTLQAADFSLSSGLHFIVVLVLSCFLLFFA